MTDINIQIYKTEIEPEDLNRVRKAFEHALDRFSHMLREVQVRFVDVNGPKGGIDKKCSVQMRLCPRGLVVVRSTRTSFVEAANDACDKARGIIAKRIGKQMSKINSDPLKAIAGRSVYTEQ